MASIIAHQMYEEIRRIARSDNPIAERRAAAAERINQFAAEVASVRPTVAEQQKASLQRTLQRSATHHAFPADENSVYAEALDALLGKSR